MGRKARFAGIEFSAQKTADGFHFDIKSNQSYREAQSEVFQLFDQFREEARKHGVSAPEIMSHWLKKSFSGWSRSKK